MTWEPLDASSLSREEAYRLARRVLEDMISGIDPPPDAVALMSTLCSLVKTLQPHVFWVGFYRLAGGRLLVGPYQGTPGCIEISLDRGICGRAARERRPVLVDDVTADPDHIACDPRSRSELVLPVFDAAGRLAAVLDLDSDRPAAFDETDVRALAAMLEIIAPFFSAP